METFEYVPDASHTVVDGDGNLLLQVNVDANSKIESVTVFTGLAVHKSIGTVYPNSDTCLRFHGVYVSKFGLWSPFGVLSKRYEFCTENFRFVGVAFESSQE